jgi:hypothetical protein
MMRQLALFMILLCSYSAFSQVADSSDIDSEIQVNLLDLPEEIIELAEIKLPASLAQFSGIRFVDIRADTSCMGYVKLRGSNQKIVFLNGLINELNTKQSVAQSNTNGDSLIVYIKKCWITRIIDLNKIYGKKTGVYEKPERLGGSSFCHITAAYFIKNTRGLYYSGKLDSIALNKKRLTKCYSNIADEAVAMMLEQPNISTQQNPRYFTEKQVQEALSKPVLFPEVATMADGIFLSYADFKAGKILKSKFILTPRISGYKAEFEDDTEQAALTDFWGICYKNQFYIKHDYFVTKLTKSGNTFVTLFGYVDFNETAVNIRNADANTRIKGLNKVTDSKYKKSDYDFVPLILDPLTGLLY